MKDWREQLQVQRPRGGDRFVELSLRRRQELTWHRSSVLLQFQLLVEVQLDDRQELLESVVQRLGNLLARMVFGEREVPRHLTQLRCPPFQLCCALLAFGDI